jgi:type II secretory pathway pseudopilin PulG
MGKRQNVKVISRKEEGITLIALVITIVILIILATVSISIIFAEGGLIDRAQQAKDLTEQATLKEQQGLNSLMDEMANIMAEGPSEEKPAELSYITAEYQEQSFDVGFGQLVEPDKNQIRIMYACTIDKFTITAYYTDGSSKTVSGATINKEGITPQDEGLKANDTFSVTVTYTENNIVKTADIDLKVINPMHSGSGIN